MSESWLDRQLAPDPEPTPEPEAKPTVEEAIQEAAPEATIEAKVAPKEEPKAEIKAEPEKKPVHQVPLPELLRERDKRQQAENERNQLKDQVEAIRKEIESLRNPLPPVPNKDEDPAGYFEHQQNKLQKELEGIKQENEARTKQQEAERKRGEVQNYISRYEADFEKASPDYRDALAHVRQMQVNSLMERGADFNTAMNQVFQHEFQEAVNLMAYGYNPAQMLYEKAKRAGYAKAEPKVEEKPADNTKDKAAVENLDKAIQAAKGQGNKGGTPNLKDMLEADDNMFSQIFSQTFGAKR